MNRPKKFLLALLFTCALLSSAPPAGAQAGVAGHAPAADAASASVFRRALYRHVPVLRFDSGEDFFPVRVQAVTDNIGNKLVRGNEANTTIAARENNEGELTIRYLRKRRQPDSYPNGDDIRDSDRLDERGSEVSEYLADARDFQRHASYRDYIYGRIVPIREGDRVTGAWLQYWFFYYYNDFPRVTTGDHEGDWELIQVRVDAEGRPSAAVYANHGNGSKCAWAKMRPRGARPVVYVALGSHASYFGPGRHGNDFDVDGGQPRRVRKLIRVSGARPHWINWPGSWGNSRGVAGEFLSPRGPKFQGEAWDDPEAFWRSAAEAEECK